VSQQARSVGIEYVLLGSDSTSQTWPFGLIFAKTTTIEDTMPTLIRMFAKLEEPAEHLGDDFRAVVLFSGIGLVVTLIAVCNGVQGVWL
jgi:hypothetical protein